LDSRRGVAGNNLDHRRSTPTFLPVIMIEWRRYSLFTGLQKSARDLPIEISIAEDIRNGNHFPSEIVRDLTDLKRSKEAPPAR
jgi:hypothetical protein